MFFPHCFNEKLLHWIAKTLDYGTEWEYIMCTSIIPLEHTQIPGNNNLICRLSVNRDDCCPIDHDHEKKKTYLLDKKEERRKSIDR